MDMFDPFENHEKVIDTPKETQPDPFSWNDNATGDILDPGPVFGETQLPQTMSPGIYPSLSDGGSGSFDTGVDPYDSFRELAPASSAGVFSLEQENLDGSGVFPEETYTDIPTNQAINGSWLNNNTGEAVVIQSVGSESLEHEKEAVPRIEVSDTPDSGALSSVGKKAKAVYDFDAEPGTGEISIQTGEVLTVTRTDVGEGWWEGRRANGDCGLFPEAYVEEVTEDVGPPAMAPPPLPQDYAAPSNTYATPSTTAPLNTFGTSNPVEDWSADPWSGVGAAPTPQQQTQDWQADDDWDSDFDDESASQVGASSAQGNGAPANYTASTDNSGNLALPAASYQSNQRGSIGDVSAIGRNDSKKGAGGASSKTSFNRFSVFVKSGSENYILGKVNLNVPEADSLTIVDKGDGKYSWVNTKPPFSCVIASPKKEAKFKGLKSYIAYQLTPSFNNIQVSRRYKHFDWLHERLSSKYNFVPIPPLPDKQIQGRYEEEFIEHRMNQLQSFVDRMCRHPVLAQSEVWGHFLSCTDEKRWKGGKRKAEKDPLVGGAYYSAITVPDKPLDPEFVDREVQVFTQFTSQFDVAVKNMAKLSADQTTKCQNHYKREFQLIGKSFAQLGQAMEQDGGNYNPGLNNAVVATGECYEEIGRLYEEQPRLDWEHLADMMHDYKGLLSGFPQVLHLHSGSQGKRKEIGNDGKVGQVEANAVKTRTDTVTYALLAEVNTFHEQRVKDIKSSHQHFLQEQIKFYQKITEKLQETLRMYDQC